MNTYLKYQPPAIQFLTFLAFAGGFFLLSYILSNMFFSDVTAVLFSKNPVSSPHIIAQFKWAQLLSAIISFLLPALLLGYFSSPDALPYVGVQKTVSPVLVIASVVFLFSIQPFIGWLGAANARFNFGSMQRTLEEMEALYARAMGVFLQMKSPTDLIINLLIMALLPAIAEELFFRGALQKVLLRLSNQPWLAILVSSAVFALLHNTFFKILPIFTLGLFFGIIYHITSNLWYTILLHFINNSIAVLSVYYADRSPFLKKLADDGFSVPLYGALVSLVIGIGVIYFMKRKSDEVLVTAITNEDSENITE